MGLGTIEGTKCNVSSYNYNKDSTCHSKPERRRTKKTWLENKDLVPSELPESISRTFCQKFEAERLRY